MQSNRNHSTDAYIKQIKLVLRGRKQQSMARKMGWHMDVIGMVCKEEGFDVDVTGRVCQESGSCVSFIGRVCKHKV